eukprot:scaffold1231_cov107-Cylindrotheca_fusiformis.AAC.15
MDDDEPETRGKIFEKLARSTFKQCTKLIALRGQLSCVANQVTIYLPVQKSWARLLQVKTGIRDAYISSKLLLSKRSLDSYLNAIQYFVFLSWRISITLAAYDVPGCVAKLAAGWLAWLWRRFWSDKAPLFAQSDERRMSMFVTMTGNPEINTTASYA